MEESRIDQSPAENLVSNMIKRSRDRGAGEAPDAQEVETAVYGDTDLNPNADDQHDAHHAEPGEHL